MDKNSSFPLSLGGAAQCQRLSEFLADSGFNETEVSRRLGIQHLGHLDGRLKLQSKEPLELEPDRLGCLTSLFVAGHAFASDGLQKVLPAEVGQLLFDFDLLRYGGSRATVFSPVSLCPLSAPPSTKTLLLASDRGFQPDGRPVAPFSDMVFSGHNPLTRRFLNLLPEGNSDAVLDLCTGTGVAAIAVSTQAETVAAADITSRSVHFTRFNCLLNGSSNVEVLEGDLYQPVADRSFDRILAHPPYVPSLQEHAVYRDGGETGERIVRRVIEGLPGHLAGEGTFLMLSIAMDTEEQSFEERVRSWLGKEQGRFDVLFGLEESLSPDSFADLLVTRVASTRPGDRQHWQELFERLRVREVVYGVLVLKRTVGDDLPGMTRRVKCDDGCRGGNFHWLMNWLNCLRRPGIDRSILEAPVGLEPRVRVIVEHAVREGQLVPDCFELVNSGWPFTARVRTQPWVVSMLSRCDGSRNPHQIFEEMKEERRLPEEMRNEHLLETFKFLAERGFLEAAWVPATP